MKMLLLILILAEFGCAIYYKRKAICLEKGFIALAKRAYNLQTKEECQKLAEKIVSDMKKDGTF